MLTLTREYAQRHGMSDRSDYIPGNMREVDFGRERFDVALLGNIAHSEGETHSRSLFRKLFESLKPGGRLAVIDMIPNEERSGPVFPILFALNMLVNTELGDTFTLSEYEAWLTGAGFERVETASIGIHSPLVVAVKG